MHDSIAPHGHGAPVPALLTVAEAARELRIGRTLAYQLVAAFEAGDPTGLPVIRLGNCLRVPRWALDELIRLGRVMPGVNVTSSDAADDRRAHPAPTPTPMTRRRNSRTSTSRATAQLSLLDGR